MSVYIGTSELKSAYVGTTPVKEIYVGTTKVRPTYWYYTPTSNTLAYRPLRNNLEDYSSGGHDLVHESSGTVTYNNNMAISTDTLMNSNTFIPKSGAFTINVWWTQSSWNNIGERDSRGPIWYMQSNSGDYTGNFILGSSWKRLGGTSGIPGISNVVVTRNGSSFILYVNGVQTATMSGSGSMRSTPMGFYIAGYSNGVGAVVLENRTWVAQEVADYYNNSKGNYGL